MHLRDASNSQPDWNGEVLRNFILDNLPGARPALRDSDIRPQAHLAILGRTFIVMSILMLFRVGYSLATPVPIEIRFQLLAMQVAGSVALVLLALLCLRLTQFTTFAVVSASLGLTGLSGIGAIATQFVLFYTGRQFPLVDAYLAGADEFVGFDWPSYFRAVCASPFFGLLAFAYHSIWWQPITFIAAAIGLRRVQDCYAFQLSLPLSFAVTCVLAALFPALGAYEFHGMTSNSHANRILEFTNGMTAPISWLRAGEFHGGTPDFHDVRVISFPSWHGAAGAIFMASFWRMPVLRLPAVILNIALLLATPVQGSHYLMDLVVGVIVGLTALSVSRRLVAWDVSCSVRFVRKMAFRGSAGSDRSKPVVHPGWER